MLVYLLISLLASSLTTDDPTLGFEASPVDGLLLDPNRSVGGKRPEKADRVWIDGRGSMVTEGLPFDVKYQGWTSSTRSIQQGNQILSSYFLGNYGKTNIVEEAQIYICLLQNIHDHWLIVPKGAFEAMCKTVELSRSAGLSSLLLGSEPLTQPFMVHVSDLNEAVRSLWDASQGLTPYRNPSTGVSMLGFRPQTVTCNSVCRPCETKMVNSMLALQSLWASLEAIPDVRVRFNPIAPLICDFLIKIPGCDTELRVEHKAGEGRTRGSTDGIRFIYELNSSRCPFHHSRQWHWLIWEPVNERGVCYCFGRHDAKNDWISQAVVSSREDDGHIRFSGPRRFENMVRRMGTEAQRAIDRANQLLAHQTWTPESHAAQNRYIDPGMKVKRELGEARGSHCPKWKLDWLCLAFNEQCARKGSMVLAPLDASHPLGNMVVVEHKWTEAERQDYFQNRLLPNATVGQPQRLAVVVRFFNLSGCSEKGHWPLWMKSTHRAKSLTAQPFIILGDRTSLLSQGKPELNPDYLFFPSEFTAFSDPDNVRCDRSVAAGHNGSGYFRHESATENRFGTERKHNQLRPGIAILKGHEQDPLRHMVNLVDGSLYSHFLELLHGQGEQMVVRNPQSLMLNRSFHKAPYLTTMQRVHQAAWDYGCKFQFLHLSAWLWLTLG